jgi:mono/diheme cytochrome c family protein
MTARNLTATCFATVLLGFAPILIDAASAADIAAGEVIAKRWCVSCHAVSPAPQKVATEAATFVEIAKRPDFNEKTLAYFLLDPHPKMPDMSLTRTEAGDLAAYIRSQEK